MKEKTVFDVLIDFTKENFLQHRKLMINKAGIFFN